MKFTHAGGVVFKREGDKTYYLIISSSDGENWVLPKGHIEFGETLQETALRELLEEVGIVGEIVAELSTQSFKRIDELINVQYFLIKKLKDGKAIEIRSVQWLEEKTALKLLSFEDNRKVLSKGARVLESLKKK